MKQFLICISMLFCLSIIAYAGKVPLNYHPNGSTHGGNGETIMIPLLNNNCDIAIIKHNYVPYVARVGTTVYLQNETILKDLHIFSTNTYIGSDVTSTKDQGSVSIEKGKVTNKSQGAVTIKNNFEIKKGAELEIIN